MTYEICPARSLQPSPPGAALANTKKQHPKPKLTLSTYLAIRDPQTNLPSRVVDPLDCAYPDLPGQRAMLLGQQRHLCLSADPTVTAPATHWFKRMDGNYYYTTTPPTTDQGSPPLPTPRAILSAGPNSALPRRPSG